MASDPFDSPKLLLNRGRKHLDDLKVQGRAFADSQPYARFRDFDSQTGEYIHGVRVTGAAPMELALVAADVLSNLKSALDHALCASVATLDSGTALNGISFPFGVSLTHYENARKVGCKKVAPEILPIIDIAQPYKGGNDLLWSMNALTGVNRHRMLQGVALVADNGLHIRQMFGSGRSLSIMAPIWNSAKNELVFFRTVDASFAYDLDIEFFIAFGDVEIVGGKPAIPALHGFAHMVGDIIGAIEAETSRMLAFRS